MCFVNGNLFVMVECCAVCKGTVKAFFFSFIALSQDSCIFFFFSLHFVEVTVHDGYCISCNWKKKILSCSCMMDCCL